LAILYHSLACHGFTSRGVLYFEAMLVMSQKLRLFGRSDQMTAEDLVELSEHKQRAISNSAWGAFNLTT
jgi:hypothetical protein